MNIQSVKAIEILDSRGNPTVRAFITLEDGTTYSSSVPSGASTGSHEAAELRDEDKSRYGGKGVQKAVEHINNEISNAILGMSVTEPDKIDQKLLELDGTENKTKLGANAILAVSQAAIKAGAGVLKIPVWKFINQYFFEDVTPAFPRLLVNIVNGGKPASWNFDIQEFMVVPNSSTPSEAVRIAAEIFHSLGKELKQRGLSTLLGDEGGYSPALNSNEEVLEMIIAAAKQAGYENVKDYRLSLDCAATEFFKPSNETARPSEALAKQGKYILKKSNRELSSDELTEYYAKIGQEYKILSFEDPFAEDDWEAHKKFADMAERFQFITIGDDLFVTNPKRIERGIQEKAANAVLIKVNQIGSVFETVQAIKMTRDASWKVVISHRSGETEDSFIADLAYACGADFIKTGSMARSERLAKYNRLIEIENNL